MIRNKSQFYKNHKILTDYLCGVKKAVGIGEYVLAFPYKKTIVF